MKHRLLGMIAIALSAGFAAAEESVTYLGNASCATSTCHGGVIGRGPAWNHSLSTWIGNDPHAGAGRLLRDADSRAIVVRLEPRAEQSPEIFDTVLRNRCISCHATATPQQCAETGLLDDAILADGVSCEACHGAAANWLESHVTVAWSGPQRFEPETAMRDTESVLGRAETCVRCHVGSRRADGLTRDMNHDLIAAGHPALRFDLLIYNENLPKHWDVTGQVEQKFAESALRVRGVGRATSLAAAAALSAERAADHLKNPRSVPWPELSDYDCFACHQSLSIREFDVPGADRKMSPLQVSDGLPVWNAWHTIHQLEIRGNRELLKKFSPHRSDPKQLETDALSLASRYRELATKRSSENFDGRDTVRVTFNELRTQPPLDWHQAAIQYLDLDAALRDLSKDPSTATKANGWLTALGTVEAQLRFDPARLPGQMPKYHSPVNFDPQKFKQAVLSVFMASPTTTPK